MLHCNSVIIGIPKCICKLVGIDSVRSSMSWAALCPSQGKQAHCACCICDTDLTGGCEHVKTSPSSINKSRSTESSQPSATGKHIACSHVLPQAWQASMASRLKQCSGRSCRGASQYAADKIRTMHAYHHVILCHHDCSILHGHAS